MFNQCVSSLEKGGRCPNKTLINSNYCSEHMPNDLKGKIVVDMGYKASIRRSPGKGSPATHKTDKDED